MCDLGVFVKELKERFTRWFNKVHGRKGIAAAKVRAVREKGGKLSRSG